MSENHHDLAHEFPEYQDKIHYLKQSDGHFKSLADKYSEVTKQIHRSEQRIDLLPEAEEETLKKMRLQLKDDINSMLQKNYG